MSDLILCTPKRLPRERLVEAAQRAIEVNPANRPPPAIAARALAGGPMGRERLALVVGQRWPTSGVKLTVGFLDKPPADLQARILLHMNAWGKTANVEFVASNTEPKVRIARLDQPPEMAGYWSYVGTEILEHPQGPADHEPRSLHDEHAGVGVPSCCAARDGAHPLGFPHEHMRRQLVAKIDPDKAIKYFGRTQGWSADEVREQVLTPLEDSSLLETGHADVHSIMCYQIPGVVRRREAHRRRA